MLDLDHPTFIDDTAGTLKRYLKKRQIAYTTEPGSAQNVRLNPDDVTTVISYYRNFRRKMKNQWKKSLKHLHCKNELIKPVQIKLIRVDRPDEDYEITKAAEKLNIFHVDFAMTQNNIETFFWISENKLAQHNRHIYRTSDHTLKIIRIC